MRRMSAEQWRTHVENDHLPYSRECTTCLAGAGRGKPHRKVPTPEAYTLSLDLCGPFRSGKDQDRRAARYFVTAVFTVPVKKDGATVSVLAPGLAEMLKEEGVDPEDPEGGGAAAVADGEVEDRLPWDEEEGAEEGEREPQEDPERALMEWERLEVESREVEVRNLTLVECAASKKGPEVTAVLARLVAKLQYLGLPVRRVHSDAAREWLGTVSWCAQRGIYRTFTAGSDWKGNGRCEAEVGVIRRGINVLLRASHDPEELWPMMARHVGERRGRQQLAQLGYATPKLLPWGLKVMVASKVWHEFQGHWRSRRRPGRIRGADASMSLSSGGHYVELEDGNHVRAHDVVVGHELPGVEMEQQELAEREEPGEGLRGLGEPRRRLTEKTTVAAIGLKELMQRLHRGLAWANEEFKRLETPGEGREVGVSLVYDLDKENDAMRQILEDHVTAVRSMEVEQSMKAAGEEVVFQTRTVALKEVKQNLAAWKDSMAAEYRSLLGFGVIAEISEEDGERKMMEARQQGKLTERIPATAVFTVKAPSGRKKTRACACGNWMAERDSGDVYAGGVDTIQVRALLRKAAIEGWDALTLGVKSAFLLAPTSQKDCIVVDPPRVMQEAGVVPWGSVWLVTGALYGLTTSPRDWSNFRDAEIQKLQWRATLPGEAGEVTMRFVPAGDNNLWRMIEVDSEKTLGYMAIYVDDTLMVGSVAMVQGASGCIRELWETSEPEWASVGRPMRFLGMDIEKTERGGFRLHQEAFTRELLDRHEVVRATQQIRILEEPEQPDEAPDPKLVKRAQGLAGELLWLSGRTRPDLTAAVQKLAGWATKRPDWSVELAGSVLQYLKATLTVGLVYEAVMPTNEDPDLTRRTPRGSGTMEIFVDASFGVSGGKSISGVVVMYGGAPVMWDSRRQGITALSTAEAELTALVDGLLVGRSIKALLEVLGETVSMELYNDNRAALILVTGQGGSWRTRHLRIRAAAISEAIQTGEVEVAHRMGTKLLADALTKLVPVANMERFREGMGMVRDEPQAAISVRMVKTVSGDIKGRMEKAAVAVLMGEMLKGSSREPSKGVEGDGDGGDWGWLLLIGGVLVIYELLTRLGVAAVRKVLQAPPEQLALKVKILDDMAALPEVATAGSAGMDLATCREVVLNPGGVELLKTGLAVEIPVGHYLRIAEKSSLAKRGLRVGAGVIDSDYRGEIRVVMQNLSSDEVRFRPGEKVAQMLLEPVVVPKILVVDGVEETGRGEGGFGSTGPRLRAVGRVSEETTETRSWENHPDPWIGETVREGWGDVPQREPCPVPAGREGAWLMESHETEVELMERVARTLEPGRSWVIPGMLREIIKIKPKLEIGPDSPKTMSWWSPDGVEMIIHRHKKLRQKLFDVSHDRLPESWNGCLHLMWMESGMVCLRLDRRKGASMPYMQEKWVGYTVFYQ